MSRAENSQKNRSLPRDSQWGAAYRLAGNHEEQQAALKVHLGARAMHCMERSQWFVHTCCSHTSSFCQHSHLLSRYAELSLSHGIQHWIFSQSKLRRTDWDLPGKPCITPDDTSVSTIPPWQMFCGAPASCIRRSGSWCQLAAPPACSSIWSGGRSSTTRGTAPTSSAGTPPLPRWCRVRRLPCIPPLLFHPPTCAGAHMLPGA